MISRVKPGKKWPDIDGSHVSRWGDFNLANLRHAFQDILSQAPSTGSDASKSQSTLYSINTVLDVKCMAMGYLYSILDGPIADGAAVLGQRMRCIFLVVSIDRDVELASGPAPPRPAISFFFDGPPRNWLILGAARKHSSSLATGSPKDTVLEPLRQLAFHARGGGTPYTFIVTDNEVVVVRFFLIDSDPKHLGAQWKAISWYANGNNVLTANLAIWCLVMMALNEDHRKLQAHARTLRLDAWNLQGDPEETVFYEHCLSLRTMDP